MGLAIGHQCADRAQAQGIFGGMGYHDQGDGRPRGQLGHQIQHFGPQARAQRCKWLVQQQQRAALQQHPRQGGAALLPARQICRAARAHACQAHTRKGCIDLLMLSGAVAQRRAQAQPKVLRKGEMAKKVVVLEQNRDRPRRGWLAMQRLALPQDAPRCQRLKPRDCRQQRRFTRPAGANQCQFRTALHCEISA